MDYGENAGDESASFPAGSGSSGDPDTRGTTSTLCPGIPCRLAHRDRSGLGSGPGSGRGLPVCLPALRGHVMLYHSAQADGSADLMGRERAVPGRAEPREER